MPVMPSPKALTDQLRELYEIAERTGLTVAADFLEAHLEQGDDRLDCEALSDAYWQEYGRPVNDLPTDATTVSEHEEP